MYRLYFTLYHISCHISLSKLYFCITYSVQIHETIVHSGRIHLCMHWIRSHIHCGLPYILCIYLNVESILSVCVGIYSVQSHFKESWDSIYTSDSNKESSGITKSHLTELFKESQNHILHSLLQSLIAKSLLCEILRHAFTSYFIPSFGQLLTCSF